MDDRTTVFYVDDNPKSSRLLSSVLEECGFRVIPKNDPLEALAACKRTYFDVALLDYEMPEMSGAKLAQEIKSLVPDVPVILISGKSFMPPPELAFVDAHFGFGTSLDDLLWTMRILTRPRVVTKEQYVAGQFADRLSNHLFSDELIYDELAGHLAGKRDQREIIRWADST
jgi:CheY-like chemotaxis protein